MAPESPQVESIGLGLGLGLGLGKMGWAGMFDMVDSLYSAHCMTDYTFDPCVYSHSYHLPLRIRPSWTTSEGAEHGGRQKSRAASGAGGTSGFSTGSEQ